MANQKYGFPALVSFFIPGLGQIIKGEVIKGILSFSGYTPRFIQKSYAPAPSTLASELPFNNADANIIFRAI